MHEDDDIDEEPRTPWLALGFLAAGIAFGLVYGWRHRDWAMVPMVVLFTVAGVAILIADRRSRER